MTEFEQIVGAIKKLNANTRYDEMPRMFLVGEFDDSGVLVGNPYNGLDPNRVWLHDPSSRSNTIAVDPFGGLQSRIEVWAAPDRNNEGLLTVIGLTGRERTNLGAVAPAMEAPRVPPELGPATTLSNINDFRVHPTGNGLELTIKPGWYIGLDGEPTWFNGKESHTPTPTSTASKHAWVKLGYDISDGAIVQALGTDRALALALDKADINSIDLGDTDIIPIAAIDLSNGQTAAPRNDDVVQLSVIKAGPKANSGDVTGPASATDNAIARFDSTTGKLIQNSLVTIGDNGQVAIPLDADVVAVTVTQNATQTANPFELKDNAANIQIAFTPDGGAIFNEEGNDVDLRVESDAETHMLFVDAGNNRVGIGESTPVARLHVDSDVDEVVLQLTGHSTQTADFILIEDSSNNELVSIDDQGILVLTYPTDDNTVTISPVTATFNLVRRDGIMNNFWSVISDGDFDVPIVTFRKATDTGTNGQVSTNKRIGLINFAGSDDGGNFTAGVQFDVFTTEALTTTAKGHKLMIRAITAGDTSATKVVTIEDENLGLGASPSFAGGIGVLSIQNAGTVPSSNPSGGGVLYAEAGALKWRGSSGTVTTIAAA